MFIFKSVFPIASLRLRAGPVKAAISGRIKRSKFDIEMEIKAIDSNSLTIIEVLSGY
jgi:hypothetical protein